ncbi:MAG: protoheme IX farnesyltransferase [Chloroflexi bacterium]|nr:protoheme IX farnesyltransferase [Chloroflexota bacterium]
MAASPSIRPLLTSTPDALFAPGDLGRTLFAFLSLSKPRIVSLVVFTAVVACFAAAGGTPPLGTVLVLTASGLLATGGAAMLNQYLDRDIDALMQRTRRRALVTGQVPSRGWVPVVGVALVASGVVGAAALNLVVSAFVAAGAGIYVVVYTLWLKRRTWLNIVVGGAAGSAAVLGGWAAVDPGLGPSPWLMAALVFFWTPAHFWSLAVARSDDYRRAGVPMLPVVVGPARAASWAVGHIFLTVATSLALGFVAGWGAVYSLGAILAGARFSALGMAFLRRPSPDSGWAVFKFSGPYLGIVFVAVLVDQLFLGSH